MLPSGAPVASFGVATNRVWKNQQGEKQEEVEFHNVVVFGRQAEIANQYLAKGRSVFVEGRLQTRSWDAPDGAKRNRTEIIAERIQFGPRASGGFSKSEYEPKNDSAGTESVDAASKNELPEIDINEGEIKPEDLPF